MGLFYYPRPTQNGFLLDGFSYGEPDSKLVILEKDEATIQFIST